MKKTVSFARDAINVFFHILTSCNLKCRHCYINPGQHGSKTLSLTTIRNWLRLFANRSKQANVVFLGGEPTLHPDLPRIIEEARALNYQSITVDTNGYLFNDILSKVGPGDVDYFSFSLDGATDKTNDAIRGAGTYDACLKGIKSAVSKGFSTSIIYTVSRVNIHELTMMQTLVKGLGVDRFFIQVIGVRGKPAQNGQDQDHLQVSNTEWLSIVPAVAGKIARLGIVVTYPKVFLASGETFECAGRVAENYFIFPNGRVYRCPLCEDYPLHSLAIKEDHLMPTEPMNEMDLFQLNIPEGCVMNRLVQPGNISYRPDGSPENRIACCLLKEEIRGDQPD